MVLLQAVIGLFHDKCDARLHWGKAGWPEHEPCYDGSKHLPKTWCHFGCAVQVCWTVCTAFCSESAWHIAYKGQEPKVQQDGPHVAADRTCVCSCAQ